jgi:hypothetical protein
MGSRLSLCFGGLGSGTVEEAVKRAGFSSRCFGRLWFVGFGALLIYWGLTHGRLREDQEPTETFYFCLPGVELP